MNYKKLLALIIIAFGFQSHAQDEIPNVYLSEILEEALFSGKDKVGRKGVNIMMDEEIVKNYVLDPNLNNYYDLDWYKFFKNKYPDRNIEKDSFGRLIIPAEMFFIDVQVESNLFLRKLVFQKPVLFWGEPTSVGIDSCVFNGYSIRVEKCFYKCLNNGSEYVNNDKEFYFTSNEAYGEHPMGNSIAINNASQAIFLMNQFFQDSIPVNENYKIALNDINYTYFFGNKFEVSDMILSLGDNEDFFFEKNKIHQAILFESNFRKKFGGSSNLTNVQFDANTFHGPVTFRNLNFNQSAKFVENIFDSFFIKNLKFFQDFNFDFRQLKGYKLALDSTEDTLNTGYRALSDYELSKYSSFTELIEFYILLYRNDKERGKLESANGAYYELSELHTRKYAYMQRKEPNLNNWFKWRLNQLLGFYIGYGTDPAKALVISFYIIMLFSIFYFFFPSEWDVSSKSKILKNMKLTVNKNEPKTFQTLIKAVALLFLSFLNAFTLSMNSFVTLGFGNIPTKGLARYVCIVQGFMGWFLLSLFSVALVNQVIF